MRLPCLLFTLDTSSSSERLILLLRSFVCKLVKRSLTSLEFLHLGVGDFPCLCLVFVLTTELFSDGDRTTYKVVVLSVFQNELKNKTVDLFSNQKRWILEKNLDSIQKIYKWSDLWFWAWVAFFSVNLSDCCCDFGPGEFSLQTVLVVAAWCQVDVLYYELVYWSCVVSCLVNASLSQS